MPRNFPEVDDNKDVVTIRAARKIIGGVPKRRNKRYNQSFSFFSFHPLFSPRFILALILSFSPPIPAFVSRAISSLDSSLSLYFPPTPCFIVTPMFFRFFFFPFSPKIIPPLFVFHSFIFLMQFSFNVSIIRDSNCENRSMEDLFRISNYFRS